MPSNPRSVSAGFYSTLRTTAKLMNFYNVTRPLIVCDIRTNHDLPMLKYRSPADAYCSGD
jgi:hypothetical protein